MGQLIDLQLKVAARSNVHLIVTTHVHDPEAMARFDNKISLRAVPARDGRTTYLVTADKVTTGIAAARVHTA